MSRDHAAEIRAIIDSETVGTYNAREVAARIVAKLEAADPELLQGFLTASATELIYNTINRRDRSMRGHVRRMAAAAAFADDAAKGEVGNWLSVPYSVNGARKPFGDMTAADLGTVAQAYAWRALENKMVEAFLTAVARRLGKGTVREHYTDEQLAAMWVSITGGTARPVD